MMKTFFYLGLLLAFLNSPMPVQAKPKFSSRYYDAGAQCKCLQKNLQQGQDCIEFSCQDMAGYQLEISYDGSACDPGKMKISRDSKLVVALDEVPAKVEWRFANNQPFVLIYRFKGQAETCLHPGNEGKSPRDAVLLIKGLGDFSAISGEVEVKNPNANAKARKIADQGFQKISTQKK